MTQTVSETKIEPTSSIEIVDPETAQAWLGANSNNRNLRRGVISTYARDMAAGRWQFTGDAVQFAVGGRLLNGQHRLHAIVEANVSLPLVVIRGLPSDSQVVMDTGSKRTAADAVALDGQANAKSVAAIALMVATRGGTKRDRVSTSELLEIIKSDASIEWAASAINSFRIPNVTASVLGYVYWRLSSINPTATHEFFDALSSLVGLPVGSPILALHRRLSSDAMDKRSRSYSYRVETVAAVFHAWNAWRKNESRQFIRVGYTPDGRLVTPEPVA